MGRFLVLGLLLCLVVGCALQGPAVVTVVVTSTPAVVLPSAKTGTNEEFLYATDECLPDMRDVTNAIGQFNENTICNNALILQATLAVDALERCWLDVPNPPDTNLQQARAGMLDAGRLYRLHFAELDGYCNGNGNLEVASQYSTNAKMALESALQALMRYQQ